MCSVLTASLATLCRITGALSDLLLTAGVVRILSTPPQGTAGAQAATGEHHMHTTSAKGALLTLSTPLATVPTLGDDRTAGPAAAKPHQNKSKVTGMSPSISIMSNSAESC